MNTFCWLTIYRLFVPSGYLQSYTSTTTWSVFQQAQATFSFSFFSQKMNNEQERRSRRLVLSTANFDDYVIALTTKLLVNVHSDRVLADELHHPLVKFQVDNMASLQRLHVTWFSPAALLAQPAETFQNFLRSACHCSDFACSGTFPVIGDLNVGINMTKVTKFTKCPVPAKPDVCAEVGSNVKLLKHACNCVKQHAHMHSR